MKTSKRCNNRMGDLQIDLETIFDQFFGKQPVAPNSDWTPRTDIVESEKEYAMTMELPGVDIEGVSVEMQDGVLDIYGERQSDELGENQTRVKTERQVGKFRRSFEFPTQVDADRISAEFKSGLLLVTAPKSEKVLPRKIEVKIGQ